MAIVEKQVPAGIIRMRANTFLIGLALVGLSTALAGAARGTPLLARSEISPLSDIGVEVLSGPVVDTTVNASGAGGLTGFAPLATPGTDGLLRATPPPNLLRASRPPIADPATNNFRGIPNETAPPQSGPRPPAFDRGRAPGMARAQPDNTGGIRRTTLKDLVRALINRPEGLAVDAMVAAPSRVAGPPLQQGESILNTILAIAVDKEMVETISKVLRPSIDIDGVVALNVFGLRDIALLVAPGSNSVRLIDLGSGRSMSFNFKGAAKRSPDQYRQGQGPPVTQQAAGERENIVPALMAAIRRWISTYVLNGFTLTILGLITVFWFVWGLASRAG